MKSIASTLVVALLSLCSGLVTTFVQLVPRDTAVHQVWPLAVLVVLTIALLPLYVIVRNRLRGRSRDPGSIEDRQVRILVAGLQTQLRALGRTGSRWLPAGPTAPRD